MAVKCAIRFPVEMSSSPGIIFLKVHIVHVCMIFQMSLEKNISEVQTSREQFQGNWYIFEKLVCACTEELCPRHNAAVVTGKFF